MSSGQFFLYEIYKNITPQEIHSYRSMPIHLACRFDFPVLTMLWGNESEGGYIAWSDTCFNIFNCHPDGRNIDYKPGMHLSVQAMLGDLVTERICALRYFTMSTKMSQYVVEAIETQLVLGGEMGARSFNAGFKDVVGKLYARYPNARDMAASCTINEIAGINA